MQKWEYIVQQSASDAALEAEIEETAHEAWRLIL
jgi:hypothetical protein